MNRKAAPPWSEITARCDHKLAASDNARVLLRSGSSPNGIRHHQREQASPCAKNPGPSGVFVSGRVHVWLCVHKLAPWQLPFCRPEATSLRRGFDKHQFRFLFRLAQLLRFLFTWSGHVLKKRVTLLLFYPCLYVPNTLSVMEN